MKKLVKFLLIILLIITIIFPATMARYVSSLHKTINLTLREPTYNVVYHANDTSVTGTMSPKEFTYNTHDNLDPVTYDGGAMFFDSWNTESDGSGDTYTDEADIYNISSEEGYQLDLYAQWVTICDYHITYNGFDSTSGFTTTVSENDPLSVNFGSTNYAITSVTMGGTELNPNVYTFTNNTLSIASVTGNVVVNATKIVNVDMAFDPSKPTLTKTVNITNLGTISSNGTITAISATRTITQVVVSFPYTGNGNKTYDLQCDVMVNNSSVGHDTQTLATRSGTATYTISSLNIVSGQTFTIQFSESGKWTGNQSVKINDLTVTVTFAS